jgi:hypothetical protein
MIFHRNEYELKFYCNALFNSFSDEIYTIK